MKNLSIGIDHLSVSGLPAGARDGAAIGRGIEQALGRLLESGALPAGARDLSRISLPSLRLPANATDAQIAEAVAAALHRAIDGDKR